LYLITLNDARTHAHTHAFGKTLHEEGSGRRRDLYLTIQHSQETGIYDPGGIRTRNPSKPVVADPRLGPCGHWDQPLSPGVERQA